MSRSLLRDQCSTRCRANGRQDYRLHIALTTWFQRGKPLIETVHELSVEGRGKRRRRIDHAKDPPLAISSQCLRDVHVYIHCTEYGTVSCQYQAAIRKPRRFCYSLVHVRPDRQRHCCHFIKMKMKPDRLGMSLRLREFTGRDNPTASAGWLAQNG